MRWATWRCLRWRCKSTAPGAEIAGRPAVNPTGFSADVAVVGGGIIGLCVAERLARDGLSVTIVEKQGIAAGASAGNAAGFAFSEVMPMASAATIRSSIRWFFDPTGPFSVVLRDLPQTAGWLWRFALAARRSRFEQSLGSLAALMRL